VAIPEFELIRRYFSTAWQRTPVPELCLGPGDDAAILQMSPSDQLLVSVDTLNEGVHFLPNSPADRLAQRCLRVNISDLAAMGGEPVGFTLALSLPQVDSEWLGAFSEGLAAAAMAAKCPLIGGDTTQGPLSITIQVLGKVPAGQAIRRDGAQPGDRIYVTGTLGDAAAALPVMKKAQSGESMKDLEHLSGQDIDELLSAFYEPEIRVPAAIKLRCLATAGLDLSDGLISDLQHILTASSQNTSATAGGAGTRLGKESSTLGALIHVSRLPMSSAFKQVCPGRTEQINLAVSGGDDYQLCVTIPADKVEQAESLMAELSVPFTCIGEVIAGEGIVFEEEHGEKLLLTGKGYQHFAENE